MALLARATLAELQSGLDAAGAGERFEVLRAPETGLVMVRGRMAGSQDAGRVIFVPFDQINFMTVNKKMTEVETQNMLGPALPLEMAAPAPAAAPATPAKPKGKTPAAAGPRQWYGVFQAGDEGEAVVIGLEWSAFKKRIDELYAQAEATTVP